MAGEAATGGGACGGARLGAFEVGVIDVMARRGIVPDLLVPDDCL